MGHYSLRLFGLVLLVSSATTPVCPASDAPESVQTLSSFDLTAEQPVPSASSVQGRRRRSESAGSTQPKTPKTPPTVPAPQESPLTLNQITEEPPRSRTLGPSLTSLLGPNGRQYHSNLLYSNPNMFGNLFLSGLDMLTVGSGTSPDGSYHYMIGSSLLARGAGRLSVADNNKAITHDRVYFQYSHFHNAIGTGGHVSCSLPGRELDASVVLQEEPIDRYTIGAEKTFLDGLLSAELRVPWTGTGSDRIIGPLGFDQREIGNLSLIFKAMLFESAKAGVAAGLGIEVPTQRDAELEIYPGVFCLHNDTVYLVPYIAMTGAPATRLFYHGFAQINIAANGNSLTYTDANLGSANMGALNDPTLLQLNLGTGYWLFRGRSGDSVRGLAGVLELHCTSTLIDADATFVDVAYSDAVTHYRAMIDFDTADFQGPRRDLLDMTVGLHADLAGGWLARVGTSVPLRDDRTFDAEVIVQVERRF